MGKKYFWIIFLILLLPNVLALEECKRFNTPQEIPCTVVSTFKDNICNISNGTIFNEIGTPISNYTWEEYSPKCAFNFTITTVGTYYYNGSNSIEEGIINVILDDNMLSIVIVQGIIILGFIGLGFVNKNLKLKFFSFGMALIEIIFTFGLVYAREINTNINTLMRANLLILMVLGFGIGMISLALHVYSIVNMQKEESEEKEKWEKSKW